MTEVVTGPKSIRDYPALPPPSDLHSRALPIKPSFFETLPFAQPILSSNIAPSWHHNAVLLRRFGKGELVTGFAGLGLCFYFAQRLRILSPSVLQGSRLISTGFAAMGIWLSLKNYWKDPRYCEEQFEKAEKIIRGEALSLDAIEGRFAKLRSTVLTNERLSALLLEDFQNYETLVAKHGVAILSILTPSQRDELKKRFLNEHAHETSDKVFTSQYQTEIEALDIQDDHLKHFFACRDAMDKNVDYEYFRGRYSVPLDRYSDGIRAHLRAKYLELSYLGMVQFSKDRAGLNIHNADIQWQLYDRTQEESLSVEEFFDSAGPGVATDGMLCRESAQALLSKFLTMSYREMTASEKESIRNILFITPQSIKTATNQEIARGLNDRKVILKHRKAFFDNAVEQRYVDRIRKNCEDELKSSGYQKAVNKEFYLTVGFSRQRIAEILRPALSEFSTFKALHSLDPVRDGVVKDDDLKTLQNSYIALICKTPDALNTDDWTALDMKDAQKQQLRQQLQTRLNDLTKLRQLRLDYNEAFFTLGILDASSTPKIRQLIYQHLKDGPRLDRGFAFLKKVKLLHEDVVKLNDRYVAHEAQFKAATEGGQNPDPVAYEQQREELRTSFFTELNGRYKNY